MVGIKSELKVERKLLTILLLLTALLGRAQVTDTFGLFTDRDLYASGEFILIKVFTPTSVPSGIVGIDLVSSTGNKVTAAFLEVKDQQADGFIELPDSLSSGTYLLRSSTRTGTAQTWKELYIANRFKGLPESNAFPRLSAGDPAQGINVQTIQLEGIEKAYSRKANGHFLLRLPPEIAIQKDNSLSVCISREVQGYHTHSFPVIVDKKSDPSIGNDGTIIEGTILDQETAHPFKNAVVMLSVPDSVPGFKYCTTGENGRFIFKLTNYYGKIPVVVQCYDPEKKRLLKIVRSNPENFSASLPTLVNQEFSADLLKMIAKNIESANYRKIFQQQELVIRPKPVALAEKYPFWGVPSQVIYPKLFIDLPNFDEISRELLPLVKFRSYNRNPTLQVFNVQRNNFFSDQPLLLLNGVPVRDLNDIKEMGTREIDRIEIAQSERFNGNLRFPGVVAISNRKLDCSRIKESDELIKLTLDAVQPPYAINPPLEHPGKEPDLRQVLLWQPSLKPEQTMEINFRTSDIRGSFKITIRGKGNDGKIFSREQIFEVN